MNAQDEKEFRNNSIEGNAGVARPIQVHNCGRIQESHERAAEAVLKVHSHEVLKVAGAAPAPVFVP